MSESPGRRADEEIPLTERIQSRHTMNELITILQQFRDALEPTGMAVITRRQFTVQVASLMGILTSEMDQHGEGGSPERSYILQALASELARYRIEVYALRDDRWKKAFEALRERNARGQDIRKLPEREGG